MTSSTAPPPPSRSTWTGEEECQEEPLPLPVPPLLQFLALGEATAVLETHVLPRLNPVDLAMFSRTSSACRAAVVNAGLPRAGLVEGAGVWRGAGGGVEGFAGMWRGASSAAGCGGPLRVEDFVGSVVRLAWAFENGSPWNKKTSERVDLSRTYWPVASLPRVMRREVFRRHRARRRGALARVASRLFV
jgi:hypothetical protein